MNVYFAKDINGIFSKKVAKYLQNGFVFNCGTMSGSGGEIAKVHLLSPNNKVLLNIVMERKHNWTNGIQDSLTITTRVHSFSSKKVKEDMTSFNPFNIVWNDKGEIIDTETFYLLSNHKENVYCDKKYFDSIKEKRNNRCLSKVRSTSERKEFPAKYYKVVLPFLQRQPKCKSVKLSDIDRVEKRVDAGKATYYVVAKNHHYYINSNKGGYFNEINR